MMQQIMQQGKKAKGQPQQQQVIQKLFQQLQQGQQLQPTGSNAKQLLNDMIREKTGERVGKDAIVYNTTQIEDAKPVQFVSEVTIATLNPGKVYKGKPAPNKKAAEASAAEAALRQNGQGKGKKSKKTTQV